MSSPRSNGSRVAALVAACLAAALVASAPPPAEAAAPPAPAEPSGSPQKPRSKPRPRKPTGEACRQAERLRERDCPAWIDYAVVVTYEGSESTKLVSADGRPVRETTRKIVWRARSTKPARVYRPLGRGSDLLLRFEGRGTFDESGLTVEHPRCRDETATQHRATAIEGGLYVAGTIEIAAKPDDAAVSVAGRWHGARAFVRGGEAFAGGGFPGQGSWTCKRLPVTGRLVAKNQFSPDITLPAREARSGGNESSASDFGDLVVASGPVRGSVHWSERLRPSGDVVDRDAEWAWSWTLICQETANGRC
jgi:hypothetical protein